MMKKLAALVLALAMVLSMTAVAFAENPPAEFENNNEEGVAGNWTNPDKPTGQGNKINIKKEIIAFNPNATDVHAPVVTYTYTVTPAAVSGKTVTDDGEDHLPENEDNPVTAPVNAGPTAGLVVIGTTAGTAGTAQSAAVGTLIFTNTSTWNTAADGQTNEYDITLDFSEVSFEKAGVYRYQIAETISAASYDVIAMEDGEFDTVFLDVYVDGNGDIYGYVCMNGNENEVDPDTQTKINGFVDGTPADGSDKYYTYDLVLSKDVVGDGYAVNTAFPFTVIFDNTIGYTSSFTIEQNVGSGSTGLTTLTGVPTDWNAVVKVTDGNAETNQTAGDITIKGIPAGVDVKVYETNNVAGVTYTVATSVNGGEAQTDNNVISGSTPGSAVAQTNKADHESTQKTVDTTKYTAVDKKQTVKITNTLLLISPTGVVLRIAPYVLILIVGVAVLLIGFRRRKASAKED